MMAKKIRGQAMIDHNAMLFANDVYNLYLKGIPLAKAIRHVQYIMEPMEVMAAKRELMQLSKDHYKQVNMYNADKINKELRIQKQKHGCYRAVR